MGSESSEVCRPIYSQEVLGGLSAPSGQKWPHTCHLGMELGLGLQSLGRRIAPQVLICCLNLEILRWKQPPEKPSSLRLTPKDRAECRNPTHSLLSSGLLTERRWEAIGGQMPSLSPFLPSCSALLTHLRNELQRQVVGDFLEGSPGPWHSAEPERLFLTCACLPVSLTSFISAAICGIKIFFFFASGSMLAKSRGRGRWGLKPSGWFLSLL